MEQRTSPSPSLTGRARTQRFRAGAVIVIAVAVGVILWLSLRSNGSSATATNASATTQAELRTLAASVKHPIFWAGPRPGFTYELTRLKDGSIHIRYLPSGTKVGTDKPYLTVATYPFQGAYSALKNLKGKNIVFVNIPNKGIAEYTKENPSDLHAAYPGVDYQIEVFDPTPGTARGLLVSGQLTYLGRLKAGSVPPPKPTAASVADLRALAKRLKHPIYWVGPKKGVTYELTQTAGGQLHIRYLAAGVKLGSPTPYLAIGTYPFNGAYAATKALLKTKSNVQVKMPGGGVALYSKSYPQSIHLAFPRSDIQVEVYDPSAARARQFVTSGQVQAIG
jgi:hypothetical protein